MDEIADELRGFAPIVEPVPIVVADRCTTVVELKLNGHFSLLMENGQTAKATIIGVKGQTVRVLVDRPRQVRLG